MIQFLKKPHFSSSPFHHQIHFPFSSSSKTLNPKPKSQFITDYLITTFGFSPHKAATASKSISHLTSPEKPDSVRHFFKHLNFTDSDILSIVTRDSRILLTDPATTLEPNYRALRGTGYFSDSELRQLIIYQPPSIRCPAATAITRLEFWKKLVNDDIKKLLVAFTRNPGLMCQDIDSIHPKIELLTKYGFLKENVGWFLIRGPGVMRRGIYSMEVLLNKVDEFGFRRGSPGFMAGLAALSSAGLKNFNEKMEVFRGYGWLEREFIAAFVKFPNFIAFTEKTMREKMEFLIRKVGYESPEINHNPRILGFSLKKRLMPRHFVMGILEARNMKVAGKGRSFYSVACLSDKNFVQKFILVNKEQMPELLDMYAAACAGEIPLIDTEREMKECNQLAVAAHIGGERDVCNIPKIPSKAGTYDLSRVRSLANCTTSA